MLMIDTIVREQRLDRVDFIKIDVEGFESKVLDGMKETNKLFGPLVFMEFNAFTLTAYGNISPRALLNRIIAEYGFFIVQNDSALQKIDTPDQALGFLHRNMIEHGCVDDIAFTMSPERRRAFSLQ